MKIWNTKYALTSGITRHEVKRLDILIVIRVKGWDLYLHGEGKEWHRDEQSAIKRAEVMREKKISSLAKQIKKIKSLVFLKEN